MIVHTIREADIIDGEDAEHLLDVRKRPFDEDCNETVPLSSRQLGTFQDICGYWNLWRAWKESGPPVMAYDQLQTEFLRLTGCSGEHLPEYTVDQVAYCIRHTLYESSIPMFLLEGRNRTNDWRKTYDILTQPHILEYWHGQEITFLTRKREYDNTQSPDKKDDPWWYFAEYKTVVFRPERDLPAAYLVLGAALDGAAVMWVFGPAEIRGAYPEFFGRQVVRADGQKYEPRIKLTPRDESEFFESLWVQIRLDLQHNGLLNKGTSRGQHLSSSGGQDGKTHEKKGVWEDVSEECKSAIQEYWKESEALKQEHKRLLVAKFCAKKGIDSKTFKSEKDRVKKRMKRSGLSGQ